MSLASNFTEPWAGYLVQAQEHIASASLPRLALLLFVNIPVIAVVLNVLYQFLPRDPSLPPLVFHWIPWFGSAAQYGQDPVQFFQTCREKHGNVFTFVLLGKRVTVTLGPKGNDFVFGGKHTVVAAEEVYSSLTTPVFGSDVVYDCPNETLMEQKKFVKVSLTADKFREYVGMIDNEVTQFMDTDPSFRTFQMNDTSEWGSFSAYKTMAELAILTAARTLQGKEIRDGMSKGFADLYHDLDHGFTPLHWMFTNLPLPSYWKRDGAQRKMSEFYMSIMNKRRAGNPDDYDDVMASLMKQTYRDGRPVPDHEIAHIMIALLMAGQHTSSSSTSWLLLHLADRPDIAEQLYQEQVEHFGLPGGGFREMTHDEMKKLPLLDAVVRETLRMHSPIHSIMRYVRSDLSVPATLGTPSEDSVYVVPKGYTVLASPALSQLDPLLWKDANSWDPQRWLDLSGFAAQAKKAYDEGAKVDFGYGLVSKGTESSYLPFGAGRHRCIGEQFAMLQICAIVAAIVRQVEMRIEGPLPKPDFSSMMVVPQQPCDILYRRRTQD